MDLLLIALSISSAFLSIPLANISYNICKKDIYRKFKYSGKKVLTGREEYVDEYIDEFLLPVVQFKDVKNIPFFNCLFAFMANVKEYNFSDDLISSLDEVYLLEKLSSEDNFILDDEDGRNDKSCILIDIDYKPKKVDIKNHVFVFEDGKIEFVMNSLGDASLESSDFDINMCKYQELRAAIAMINMLVNMNSNKNLVKFNEYDVDGFKTTEVPCSLEDFKNYLDGKLDHNILTNRILNNININNVSKKIFEK